MKSEYEFKVVFLGDYGVGKTSILQRFVNGSFDSNTKATIGTTFLTKKIQLDLGSVTLQLWDTTGQEAYRSLSKIYFQNSDAAILVFDHTKPGTLNNLLKWQQELMKAVEKEKPVLVIAGNKNDLSQEVEASMIQQYSQDIGAKTFDVSAKTGEGIEELFQQLASNLLEKVTSTSQVQVKQAQTGNFYDYLFQQKSDQPAIQQSQKQD